MKIRNYMLPALGLLLVNCAIPALGAVPYAYCVTNTLNITVHEGPGCSGGGWEVVGLPCNTSVLSSTTWQCYTPPGDCYPGFIDPPPFLDWPFPTNVLIAPPTNPPPGIRPLQMSLYAATNQVVMDYLGAQITGRPALPYSQYGEAILSICYPVDSAGQAWLYHYVKMWWSTNDIIFVWYRQGEPIATNVIVPGRGMNYSQSTVSLAVPNDGDAGKLVWFIQ